jgi:hypothetical protein
MTAQRRHLTLYFPDQIYLGRRFIWQPFLFGIFSGRGRVLILSVSASIPLPGRLAIDYSYSNKALIFSSLIQCSGDIIYRCRVCRDL